MVGLFVAFLTWFLIGDHVRYLNSDAALVGYLGWIIITFISPGIFVAIMLSGNVHVFETLFWCMGFSQFANGGATAAVQTPKTRSSVTAFGFLQSTDRFTFGFRGGISGSLDGANHL
jgi:hypothetical protein